MGLTRVRRTFSEKLYPGYEQTFEAEEILFETQSAFQNIKVILNPTFGKMLLLDDIAQTTVVDNAAYHEFFVHVPIYEIGYKVKNILVIGGGDGGIIREVCKHKSVEKIVMCELDQAVTEASKKYLPELSDGAFEDPRLDLTFNDGAKFVEEYAQRIAEGKAKPFDIIFCDSSDPIGPAEVLFSRKFYEDCKKISSKNAIFVAQNGASMLQLWELKQSYERNITLYSNVGFIFTQVPTYVGGYMSLLFATNNMSFGRTHEAEIERRCKENPVMTELYNPGMHFASFKKPQNVVKMIEEVNKAILSNRTPSTSTRILATSLISAITQAPINSDHASHTSSAEKYAKRSRPSPSDTSSSDEQHLKQSNPLR